MSHRVLILGGYGFFGLRIATALAADARMQVLVGGRNRASAVAACATLGLGADRAVQADAADPQLAAVLRGAGVQTLIHAAGPFQAQDYAVARAAIAAGCHYIDLADGRDFVAGIEALHGEAEARGLTVVSGASSVPGLSSAVIARYAGDFASLEEVRIGIASGGRSPGLATMRGVFGYCGKPVLRLEQGQWTRTHGWLDLRPWRFPPPVGMRLLGSCDVPDLALLPRRYPGLRTVTFHAGTAGPGHLVVWLLAQLVRWRLLPSLAPLAATLHRLSTLVEPLLSQRSAMFVELRGRDAAGAPLRRCWQLLAAQNHGPQIPCGASIALARKLAAGEALPRGAMPCLGLLTVEEYLAPLRHLDLRVLPA